jgi:Lon protease-like protein
MLPAILPLFPLAQVVLFPHTYLPLHIFEPRYRQLTADVLATHRHFVLALARDPQQKDPLPAEEPFFPTATLACIVKAEALEDGRWNLLVQGVQTLQILEEIPGRSYRQARVQSAPFDGTQGLPKAQEQRFMEALRRYADHHRICEQVNELLGLGMSQEVLLNTLAMALDFAPVEKLFLLESGNLPELGDRILQLMDFTLSGRRLPDPGNGH